MFDVDFMASFHAAMAETAIKLIEEMLETQPDITTHEVLMNLADVQERHQRAIPERKTAECRHCGKEIIFGTKLWFHVSDNSDRPMRGCRAASYVQGSGWNDTLDRRWSATPKDGI